MPRRIREWGALWRRAGIWCIPDQVGPGPQRFGFSILAKIFLGFAAVIAAFGALAGFGEYQNHRAISTLRLVVQDYVDFALTIQEMDATERVTMTYLSGFLDARGTAARDWLDAARKLRPTLLRRAKDSVASIRRRDLPPGERRYFAGVNRKLESIDGEASVNERRFEELFALLDARETDRAGAVLSDLERRQRRLQSRLNHLGRELKRRVRDLSNQVAIDQARSRYSLLGLTALALAVALVVWILVFRTLSPIRRMRETAAAVARGDLTQRLAIRRNDELGRLAEELDRMTDALMARDERLRAQARDLIQAERLATIGKMAAHITHEVRNPLSSIGLNTELLQEEVARLSRSGDGREATALLESIGREIDRLTAITEEYLRFARLPDPRRQPEDLAELVQSVADFVRPELEAAGLLLAVDVQGPPPTALVDESQIRQALLNLLRNAREATPRGGAIAIGLQAVPGGAVISVQDSGPGVPPEHAAQIFDAFFTTKEHGTGLGLPLVKQILVAHGGSIECTSDLGRGATFVLRLPAVPASSRDEGEPRPSRAMGVT